MNDRRGGSNARHRTACHSCRGRPPPWTVAAWPIIGACALALLTGQAHGQDHSKPQPQPPPAPDSQSEPQEKEAPVPRADRKQMLQAWERFKQANEGNWWVSWDDKTGLPRKISGGMTRPYPGTPREAAEAFLHDHQSLYGLDHEHYTLRHFETRLLKRGHPVTFVHHRVTFVQQYKKLDVANTALTIMVDPDGRIGDTGGRIWPVRDVDVKPKLTSRQAMRLVEHRYEPNPDPIWIWTEAQLVIYPRGPGRLAYLVSRQGGEFTLPWEFAIDAVTGEVLQHRQVIKTDSPASKQDDPPTPDPPTPRQKSRGPIGGPPQSFGPPPGPCDREWEFFGPGPGTDVTVEPAGTPPDPYDSTVGLGQLSVDRPETGFQLEGFRGAQIQLLPCIPYTITVAYDLYSWDSYNSVNGFWDVIFFNINSETSIFAPGVWDQLGDVFCSTAEDSTGVWLPGYTWWFGGENSADGMQCHLTGTVAPVMFHEPDSSLEVFLAAAIDTGFVYPSWGTFNIEIDAQSHIFDPNPITALNDNTLTDQDDINAAVPCDAYTAVDLSNLDTPAPGDPWQLTGDYCQIADLLPPPGGTGIPFTPPTSRNDDFPYIRDCDAFEAVMAYDHITRNQLYIQGLGFTNVNNRQIRVDPHHIAEDNSFYIGNFTGTGHLGFGDGGTDDAEDADVILHEYGHAIQDNQRPNFFGGPNDNGFGDETGAIGEGFGDYWACSTFNAQNEASGFNPALFAEWDAPPDGLRNLANSKIYPDDMVNLIHADGEIWSGAMWDIFHLLGKATTDTLVLESHFQLMMADPDFVDNAEAVLAADVVHFAGANRLTLAEAFAARGIFRQLTVQSSPAGAAIDLDIADVLGDEDGTTEFVRFYPYNQAVTLTAPAMHSGNNFNRWRLDGVPQPAGELILDVIMNQAHTARAIFGTIGGLDLNGDGSVADSDLLILLANWGLCTDCDDCPADIDGDCTVDGSDLLILLGNWG